MISKATTAPSSHLAKKKLPPRPSQVDQGQMTRIVSTPQQLSRCPIWASRKVRAVSHLMSWSRFRENLKKIAKIRLLENES